MREFTFMEEFEAEVKDVVDALWADYLDTAEIMGDRPYGFIAGDRWAQAEQYLSMRDDPAAWDAQITEWAATKGRETAEIIAISEATRLERLIAEMGGYEAVRLGVFARRLRAVEPGLERVRKILERPKATILEPLTPITDLDMLARLTSEPEAIEGTLA